MENDNNAGQTLVMVVRWTGECMGFMGIGHTRDEALRAYRAAHPHDDGRNLDFIEAQPVTGGGWNGQFIE